MNSDKVLVPEAAVSQRRSDSQLRYTSDGHQGGARRVQSIINVKIINKGLRAERALPEIMGNP